MDFKSEEKNSILYKILRFSFVYKTFQFLVARKDTYQIIFQNIFQTDENSIVLDCGCGPAQYRNLIKCSKYVGIDFNQKYIQKAISKFPDDKFYLSDISNFDFKEDDKYSHIILLGLLHHLNDTNAKNLLNKLLKQLTDNGKVVTIDPIYIFNKNGFYPKIANYLAFKDRGNYVRTKEEYDQLIDSKSASLQSKAYEKLLRVPLFHYVMYIYVAK